MCLQISSQMQVKSLINATLCLGVCNACRVVGDSWRCGASGRSWKIRDRLTQKGVAIRGDQTMSCRGRKNWQQHRTFIGDEYLDKDDFWKVVSSIDEATPISIMAIHKYLESIITENYQMKCTEIVMTEMQRQANASRDYRWIWNSVLGPRLE